MKEAEKVKSDFLEMDKSDYDGLLEKAFSESRIEEIDEQFEKGFELSMNGTKIEAHSFPGLRHITIFADNGQKYTFSRQESGEYSFFGKLTKAYCNELGSKTLNPVWMSDGEYSATLPPDAAASLMKRLVSDLVPVSELSLYGRPTKIRKKGRAGLNGMEAKEVRDHFFMVDEAHGWAFKALEGIEEIEELNYGKYDEAIVFAVMHNGMKINASREFLFNDTLVFSVNNNTYEFSKPTYPSEVIPQGHYRFNGRLNEKDYNELIEPDARVGEDELDGNKIKKFCWRREDGYCGGTIKDKVVPELMKRIISYAQEEVT